MSKLRYIAYTRKSTEDPERQVLSTPAQIKKIKEQFSNLNIIEVIEEHKSAFTEGNRPEFDRAIEMIDEGKAEGLIAWHPNRLSRNEVDAARVTSRVRKEVIKDLKFSSYTFENSPEGIWMLQMALSQGQYESAKLSRDVKRGNETKLSIGGPTGLVPQGYINNLATKMADIDPERFHLVRKMWDLLLTGNYTVPKIHDIITNEWHYRTIKRKKSGGGPLSESALYAMFNNQFYMKVIVRNGIEHKGKHKAMITEQEFDKAQIILGRKGKPRPKTHNFSYTGLMVCGECGCAITAQKKFKLIKSTGELKAYIYYHCTRHNRNIECTQRRVIEESKLEEQMQELLSHYTILPIFQEWSFAVIRRLHGSEVKQRTNVYEMQQKTLLAAEKEYDNYIEMAAREVISEEKMQEKTKKLDKDITKMRKDLAETEYRAKTWREIATKAINFAAHAQERFNSGDGNVRKEVMLELGTKLELKDKQLKIEPNPFLVLIADAYPKLERKLEVVRTKKFASTKAKNDAIASIISQWQGIADALQTAAITSNEDYNLKSLVDTFELSGELLTV